MRHGVARCGQNFGHAALQRPTKGLEQLMRLVTTTPACYVSGYQHKAYGLAAHSVR